ncbi:MAG TPA: peptidylprolyl isomerase [Candidatus Limnocylindrales bacterium]|nr:peptidylprolyl isomerase [Candidatus Limnocylindrales bacterium]
MTFFRTMLFVCPAACLLAQTPPPNSSKPQNATPVPTPTVTLSQEGPKVGATVPPDRVVLTVGSVKLTSAQFDQIIEILPEQVRAMYRGPARKQLADNLVKLIVLSDEAKRRGLDKTDAFRTQSQFEMNNVLAGLAYSELTKEAKVDDAELHKYYDDHKSEFEQVHARHILIRFQGSQVPVKPGEKDLTDAEALAKAQDIEKQLKGGGDFAAIATKESDDTGSAANGGDVGFFHHGQMVPSFEQAAFALKPGQISEPVKSQFGYHIIKLEAYQAKSFDEVKGELETKLKPEQAQKSMDDLQKKSPVVMDPEFFGTAAPAPTAPKQ